MAALPSLPSSGGSEDRGQHLTGGGVEATFAVVGLHVADRGEHGPGQPRTGLRRGLVHGDE